LSGLLNWFSSLTPIAQVHGSTLVLRFPRQWCKLRLSLIDSHRFEGEAMRYRLRNGLMSKVSLAALALGGAVEEANAIRLNAPSRPIAMVAYQDTWSQAVERWWDLGSYSDGNRDRYNQFNDWLSQSAPNGRFDYAARASNVKLTYDQRPGVPYFVGHISARGLKPNFAYQMKLTGKPVSGPRGMGQNSSYVLASNRTRNARAIARQVKDSSGAPTPINGDDWSNQQLGYAGRWWNDSNASGNTNAVTDSVYQSNITDTIYGYLFMGVFVTDRAGNAEWDVYGNRAFHITWQDWQSGPKDVYLGSFGTSGLLDRSQPPHYYGYGAFAPSMGDARHQQNGRPRVKLYYELEPGRPNPVALPRGTYHCRLLITEETFHNSYGATEGVLGGRWKTVMASEDFAPDGTPDRNVANDIVFTTP